MLYLLISVYDMGLPGPVHYYDDNDAWLYQSTSSDLHSARPNRQTENHPRAASDIFPSSRSKLWRFPKQLAAQDLSHFPAHLGLASAAFVLLVILLLVFFVFLVLVLLVTLVLLCLALVCVHSHSELLLDHTFHFVLQHVGDLACDGPAGSKRNHILVCSLHVILL